MGEAGSKNAALSGTTCSECRRDIIILHGHATTDALSHDAWRRKHGCTNSAFLPNHCVRLSSAPGKLSGPLYGGRRWARRGVSLPNKTERVEAWSKVELKSEFMRKVFGVSGG